MNEFLQTVRQAQVSIPTIELLLLLVLLTFSLVFKSTRTGLLVAYVFIYRWGWLFFKEMFLDQHGSYLLGYLVFGAIILLLTVIAMLHPNE